MECTVSICMHFSKEPILQLGFIERKNFSRTYSLNDFKLNIN